MTLITKKHRIVFMGTPTFAVPALTALIEAGHDICAVYSQPPRPSGRGQKIQRSPVHCYADDVKIPVHTPINFKDGYDQDIFKQHRADVAVVAAYGLILNQTILDTPLHGCINIHASLLPRWRGAAPIQRALLAGDKHTGITIMKMDKGLDTGDMLLQQAININNTTTSLSLHNELAQLGARLIVDYLNSSQLSAQMQPETGVTYAHKLQRHEGHIDWTQDVTAIDRQIRALNPWPGTYFSYQGESIKIIKASIVNEDYQVLQGTVINDHLLIACGRGALQPLMLQRPNKPWMDVQSFLQSMPIIKGTQLTLNSSSLSHATL